MVESIVDALFTFLGVACGLLVLYGGWISLRYGSIKEDARSNEESAPAASRSAAADSKNWLSGLTILAAIAVALPNPELRADTPFDEAMRDYEHGEYKRAQTKLHAVAERGDPQAQEILGLMYAFGSQLYPGISQDLRAAGIWLDRAARAGRPVARIAYCAVARKEFPGRATHITCVDWVTQSGQPARLDMSHHTGGRQSP
jgi:TPR repeat protein